MHNNAGEFHLSTLSGISDSIVGHGIGVLFAHEDFHILLERLIELMTHIRSGKIPIWWMDPDIPWSDRLSQATLIMDGMQLRLWDLGIP